MNLDKYKLPLAPIPDTIKTALEQGVKEGSFPEVSAASEVLNRWEYYKNQAIRSKSGHIMVTCSTQMPEVGPEMIDWWFGWHLAVSERYKLWHPVAHLKTVVKDDRSHLNNDRDKYIGNSSFVDEYIGDKLHRLEISFFDPKNIGLGDVYSKGTTAVCGKTTNRLLKTDGGYLVHYILPTASGCEMRSIFWLGEFQPNLPIISKIVSSIVNTRFFRKQIVSDQMAISLFEHCAEEMNHLARFLPRLYSDILKKRLTI